MRKVFLLLVMSVLCLCSKAQYTDGGQNFWSVDLGVGGNGETSLNLGVGYHHSFTPIVAWDVLTFQAISHPGALKEHTFLQALSGLRLTSPTFALSGMDNMSIFAIGRAGYGWWTDPQVGGFTFEVGGGVNLTSHLYIGYAFNHEDAGSVSSGKGANKVTVNREMKYHSFRLGFYF